MKLFFTFYSKESIPKLHHFFNHYRNLGVTNFYAIYHTYGEHSKDVLDYVMKNAMVVKIWDGVFNEHNKIKHINDARLKFSSYGEWSFTVDCDEFIDISLNDLNKVINSDANYVKFSLIDRVSKPSLKEVTIEEDIEITFPHYSFITYSLLEGAISKVPLSVREVIIGLGYHDVIGEQEQVVKLIKHPLNGYVNHFKWDSDVIYTIHDRVTNRLIDDGSADDYIEECEVALSLDYDNVITYDKPLGMKLLFIVWSLQDYNMLKQFFIHYRTLGVTKFYCIFHTYGMEDNFIYDFVKENAEIVHHWDEKYTTEWECKLKNKYKREICDDENEWVWCVDADEFVDVSQDFVREVIRSDSNYVNGWMIDRFSEEGLIVPLDDNMFKQFPIRTYYTRFKLNGSASKIPLTRSYVLIGVGHHVVLNELYDYELKDDRVLIPYNDDEETWIEVAHIKWHYQLLEEIYNKFTKTMNLCQYSAREMGVFVLDYCYKKKSITEIIKDVRI